MKRLLRSRKGQSLTGYGLLVGLIAISVLGAIQLTGQSLDDLFGGVGNAVDNVTGDENAAPLDFGEFEGSWPNTVLKSNDALVTDINREIEFRLQSPVLALYHNGSLIEEEAVTVASGDTLSLDVQLPTETLASYVIDYKIGEDTGTWLVQTGDADLFAPTLQAPALSDITSDLVTLSGVQESATLVFNPYSYANTPTLFVNGTEYKALEGDDQVPFEIDVSEGDTLQLIGRSAENDGSTVTYGFTIAGVPVNWDIISVDVQPEFTLTASPNVALDTEISSGSFVPTGFDSPTEITISGGFYSINGGTKTDEVGVLNPEDRLELFTQSPATSETSKDVQLSLGSVGKVWSVTTGDLTPNRFQAENSEGQTTIYDFLPTVDSANAGDVVYSDIITPLDYTLPISIALANGNEDFVQINQDGNWVKSGTISPGDTLQFRQKAGNADGSPTTTRVTLGEVTENWTVIAHDITPDALVFDDTDSHTAGDYAVSNAVAITGITGKAYLSTPSDVQISVNGGGWTNFAYVTEGALVRATQFIPSNAKAGDAFYGDIYVNEVNGVPQSTATWKAVAGGVNKVPDPFTIAAATGVDPNVQILSAEVVLTGDMDALADVEVSSSTSSALISIDGGEYITATASDKVTIRKGQKFQLVTDSGNYGESVYVTIKVGDLAKADYVQTQWQVTARELDREPEGNYIVPNISTPQSYKAYVVSQTVTPTGFSDTIPITLSGTHADQTKVRVNGGSWATSQNLSPGDSFQLQMYINYADGGTKSATVKVGDSNPYNWTVPTLDMVPTAFTIPNQGPWNTSQSGWARKSGSTSAWEHTISGLGSGVNVPRSLMGNSFQVMVGGKVTEPAFYKNGDLIRKYIGAPAAPLSTSTYRFDMGGWKTSFTISSNATPQNPRRYVFDDIIDAELNTQTSAAWIEPYYYGAPMNVKIVSGTNKNGTVCKTDASTSLEVRNKAVGQSVTISDTANDQIRVYTDQTAEEVCVAVQYNNSRTTVWTSRTTPKIDKTPDAFSVGTSSVTIDYDLNQWCPYIRSSGNYITGFDGPIDVWLTKLSGPSNSANIQLILDYRSRQEVQLNPNQSIRFCHVGTRIPGETYRYRITAGDKADSSTHVSTEFDVHIRYVDRSPSAFSFSAGPTDALGNQYVQSEAVTPKGFVAPISVSVEPYVPSGLGGNDPSNQPDITNHTPQISVNGGSFSSSAQTVRSGDSVQVRIKTGPSTGVTRWAKVILHGYVDNTLTPMTQETIWSVKTVDDQPEPFEFVNLANAEPNFWSVSTTVQITGIGASTYYTVSGDGQPLLENLTKGSRTASGYISNGDYVRIWNFLDQGYDTRHDVRFKLGSVLSKDWSVTTRKRDTTPDSFSWPNTAGVLEGTLVTSANLEPLGFSDETEVVIVDNAAGTLEVSLNGGAYQSATNVGTVIPGQPIRLRMIAPAAGQTRIAKVSVGGVVGVWEVQSSDRQN